MSTLRLVAVLPSLLQPLLLEGRASLDRGRLALVRDRRVGGIERVVHPDGGTASRAGHEEEEKSSREAPLKLHAFPLLDHPRHFLGRDLGSNLKVEWREGGRSGGGEEKGGREGGRAAREEGAEGRRGGSEGHCLTKERG
ncbi:hypothetical protein BDY24DRAFT_399734 [Mrakia frigida]|uniref:uncharacterized protein n=1 Tax=Mrakia frigida TaxID=29902 RepID=UPI003FCBFAB4